MNRPVRALLGVVAAAAALAGCATTTGGSGSVAADATAGPGPTTLPSPSGSGTAPTSSPAPTPGPTGGPVESGRRVQVGSVSVPVPATARVRTDAAYLCLTLLDDTGCSLEVIDVKASRAGGAPLSDPEPGAQYGWWWGTDVPGCEAGGQVSPIARETVVTKGFRPVGPKNAAYASYLVSCRNPDLDFDPKIWWLPTSQVAFRQRSGVAGTDEALAPVLAGVTFGG